MPPCTNVCRVCLATDVRMLPIGGVLRRVYEKLAGTALHTDQRPKVVCYICHALLQKAHRLMLRAITAEKALEALTTLYSEVTKSSVMSLDRRAAGLCPSLAVSRLEYLDNIQLPGPADVKTELGMENYANGDLEDSEGTEEATEMDGTEKDHSASAQDGSDKESRPTGAELLTEQLMNNHTNGLSDDEGSTDEDSAPAAPVSDVEDDAPADSSTARADLEDADAQSYTDSSEQPPLQCPVCERQFAHKQILERHLKSVHSSPVYKCDQCEYLCATKDMFVSHLKNHLENNLDNHLEKPLKCDVCERRFARQAVMDRHMRNAHSSDSYKCEVCEYRCASECQLKTHMTTQHKKPFKCDVCGRQFLHKLVMERHKRIKHTGNFACNICERQCVDRDELKAHLATHKCLYKCLVCQKEFRTKNISYRHIASHVGEESLTCLVCERQFSQKSVLLRHLRTHVSKPPLLYKCYYCRRQFLRKGDLDRHSIIKHAAAKPFKCDVCGRQFLSNNSLQMHLRTHISEEPRFYNCSDCQRQFSRKGDLDRHSIIKHAAAKPFKCDVCGRQFLSNNSLQMHLRTHISEETRLYNCSDCQRQFSRKGDLDRHSIIKHAAAKPFKCDVCGRQFLSNNSLQMHLRTHISEEPRFYNCSDCQRQFSRKGHLDRHSIIKHAAAKPFKCDVCGRQFLSNNSLQIHLRTHISEETRLYNCADCQRQFSRKGDLDRHSIINHAAANPFKCDVCGRHQLSHRTLREHLKKHTNKYECHICLHRSSRLGNLKAHLRTHSGKKPFRCGVCHLPFSKKLALKRHMTRHRDESHRCDACHRQFASRDALHAHTATHEPEEDDDGSQAAPAAPGDKPHQCSLCPMQFSLKIAFRRHVISEHL